MSESKAIATRAVPMPPGDVLTAVAALPKRDEDKCGEALRVAATSNHKIARACLYCVPVGKQAGTNRQKFTLGESVRLAELAKNQFGMMWGDGDIIERNTAHGQESVTAKYYQFDMSKMSVETGMATVRVYGGRWELAEKNALAKARRDSILAHLKPYTAVILEDIKAAIVAGLGEKTKEAFASLVAWFQDKYNVGESELKEIVSGEESTIDKIVLLQGIKNGMEDGNIKFSDVFGREQRAAPPKTSSSRPTEGEQQEPPKQTPKQRFSTLQLAATRQLGDDAVNTTLKKICDEAGVTISKWTNEHYEKASVALADAMESGE